MFATLKRSMDAPVYRCLYRRVATLPDGSDEVQRALLTVLPLSASLRDGGRAPYETVTECAPRDPSPSLGASPLMSLDLTRPVNLATSRGNQRDSSLYLIASVRDVNGYVWNTRGIPVGTRVRRDHTSLLFNSKVEAHLLQLAHGRWAPADRDWAMRTARARAR